MYDVSTRVFGPDATVISLQFRVTVLRKWAGSGRCWVAGCQHRDVVVRPPPPPLVNSAGLACFNLSSGSARGSWVPGPVSSPAAVSRTAWNVPYRNRPPLDGIGWDERRELIERSRLRSSGRHTCGWPAQYIATRMYGLVRCSQIHIGNRPAVSDTRFPCRRTVTARQFSAALSSQLTLGHSRGPLGGTRRHLAAPLQQALCSLLNTWLGGFAAAPTRVRSAPDQFVQVRSCLSVCRCSAPMPSEVQT